MQFGPGAGEASVTEIGSRVRLNPARAPRRAATSG